MDPNGPSSGNSRVQLPSIKNLVDTLPPLNMYRSSQVIPGFMPLSQHKPTDGAGGFRTRPLHASPAPSRSVAAAAVTNTASYGRTRGEQTSINNAIQARTSRMSLSGTTAPIQMQVNQDQFHFRLSRVDSPPSTTIQASMERRCYAKNFEDSPAQGQRQAHGSYNLSSNLQFGNRSTSALIFSPDRDGVSHRSVQDLRILSTSEAQSRAGAPTPTTPLGRHPHGAMADWDHAPKANPQPTQNREGYDAPVINHARYRPDSFDRSQCSQRRQEPINHQERRVDLYPSRPHFNLEPGRWERENAPVHQDDIRNRGNSRNPYPPSALIDTGSRLVRDIGLGQNPSRSILGNEGWESSRPSDRSSGRRLDRSEQENYVPRLVEQLHTQPGAENSGNEWPYLYNRVGTSVMPSNHPPAPIRAMVRHRSKEDLERVLSDLTNEAENAIAGGAPMKKVRSNFFLAFCRRC
jgi:hypothetical protein